MASRFFRSATLALLALGLVALIPACGDENVPTPTTPAPTPPPPAPAPPPAPEPPAAPGGLRISATGPDFIEWSWTPVSGATGYDVQYSANEAFTEEDEIIARTAEEISYRKEGLEPGTSAYLRVRAAVGAGDERVTGTWSTHVTGMAEAAPAPEPTPEPPEAPAPPTGLDISDRGPDFIEWSWDPVEGVSGYDVQFSTDEDFTDDEDETIERTAEQHSYRRDRLELETSYYLRVRAARGAGETRVTSDWTSHLTGTTTASSVARPARPSGLDIADRGPDFIEWSWSPVSGATGYDVQYRADEDFTEEDDIIDRTAREISYRKEGLEPETRGYLRVRAAAGTGDARVTSRWTDHLTGMTTATMLPAPTEFQVTGQTDTTMTWSWNAVEGADGYRLQHSDSATFGADADTDSVTTTARIRTYTAANLPPRAARYARVQAYVGPPLERVFGEWSMTVEETTERPPAPTVTDLDVPANFTSTARTETSITLGWSAVTDAVGYEVDQKLGTETSWDEDGPSCGSAGVVPDTTCVATGLGPGLEYDFRVKALAGGDDTTTQDSDWSQTYSRATSGTAPPPTFETTSDLNIRWKSNATSITWTWDPVEGRELRDRTEYLVQVIPSGSGECARLDYASADTAVSRTAPPDPPAWGNIGKALSFIYTPGTLNAGTLNGLCVVATWENELPNGVTLRAYGTPERIWASAAPGVPSDLADASNPEKRDSGALKTSWLEWTYEADAGFTYPGLLVSLGGDRDTEDLDCDSGGEDVKAPAEVTTENRQARHRETNLKPYRHYQLCLQAKNEFGSSEMVGIGMVTTTRPAAPKSVTYVRADEIVRTHASGSHLVERLVWSVPETDGTPSRDDKFDSVVILSTKSSIGSNDMNTACTATGGVTLAPGDPATTYRRVGDSSTEDNVASRTSATGIEVVASHDTDLIGPHVPAGDPATYYFYACVRANPDPDGSSVDDDGPWKISAARSVSRKLSTPSRVRVSRVTSDADFTATVDWNAVNGAGAYVVQSRTRTRTRDRTRTSTSADWGGYGGWGSWDADWTASGGTWTEVSACTESGCTALSGGAYDDVSDPDGATTQTQTDVQTQVRVRATATVGGTSLTSLWSSGTEVPHTKP